MKPIITLTNINKRKVFEINKSLDLNLGTKKGDYIICNYNELNEVAKVHYDKHIIIFKDQFYKSDFKAMAKLRNKKRTLIIYQDPKNVIWLRGHKVYIDRAENNSPYKIL